MLQNILWQKRHIRPIVGIHLGGFPGYFDSQVVIGGYNKALMSSELHYHKSVNSLWSVYVSQVRVNDLAIGGRIAELSSVYPTVIFPVSDYR